MEYFFKAASISQEHNQPQFMPAEFELAKFSHSLKSYFSYHYLFIYLPNKSKHKAKNTR